MGEWSDAMADGVICEGCACPGNTETCGCPVSLEILHHRRFGKPASGKNTKRAIMGAIRNPHGQNIGGRDDTSRTQDAIMDAIHNPNSRKRGF